jgi:transcriptional regulator with XRE-family HTH domain
MNKFSEKLRTLRNEKKISQIKFASIIKYSQQVISDWENGKAEPTAPAIITIAKYFDITTDYLLGLENEDGSKIDNPTSENRYINSFNNSKIGNNNKF